MEYDVARLDTPRLMIGSLLAAVLILATSSVSVAMMRPVLEPVPARTRDGVVALSWKLVQTAPSAEWKVQAAQDEDFTRIVSFSPWLDARTDSYILPIPPGVVYLRLGVRFGPNETTAWSDIYTTYQEDDWRTYSRFQQSVSDLVDRKYPVAFIPGMGGRGSDWIDWGLYDRFEKNGFPTSILAGYDFPVNYQDVLASSRDLAGFVQELRSRSYGRDQIDLVSYSLGGLTARAYICSVSQPAVRRYISVATPHQGVRALQYWNGLDALPTGTTVQKLLSRGLQKFYELKGGSVVDLMSPVISDLSPDSSLINRLETDCNDQAVEYHVIYGEIYVELTQNFFHVTVTSSRFNLGDLVVDADSASTIPGRKVIRHRFTSSYRWNLVPRFLDTDWYLDPVPEIGEPAYWHGGIMHQSEVQEEIIRILTK